MATTGRRPDSISVSARTRSKRARTGRRLPSKVAGSVPVCGTAPSCPMFGRTHALQALAHEKRTETPATAANPSVAVLWRRSIDDLRAWARIVACLASKQRIEVYERSPTRQHVVSAVFDAADHVATGADAEFVAHTAMVLVDVRMASADDVWRRRMRKYGENGLKALGLAATAVSAKYHVLATVYDCLPRHTPPLFDETVCKWARSIELEEVNVARPSTLARRTIVDCMHDMLHAAGGCVVPTAVCACHDRARAAVRARCLGFSCSTQHAAEEIVLDVLGLHWCAAVRRQRA